jgi:hypothetical protein
LNSRATHGNTLVMRRSACPGHSQGCNLGCSSTRLQGSELRASFCAPAFRRLGAPEDLEWERVLGRSPVAAHAVSCRFGSRVRAWLAIEGSVGCSAPGRPRLTARASRSVISWVKRLTKTERLRKSLFTAATGRRAVEQPPQPGVPLAKGIRPDGSRGSRCANAPRARCRAASRSSPGSLRH